MSEWVQGTGDLSYAEQWSDLLGPVRWFRYWFGHDGYKYLYLVEGDPEGYTDVRDDEMDWKPANEWSGDSWPLSAELWSDELLREPVADAPPTAEVQAADGQPDGAGAVAPAAQQQGDVPATRLPDPIVTSSGPPEYAPRGSYAWTVTMSVAQVVQQWSWIIQKVHVSDGDMDATFWEAFPVAPGESAAAEQDVYQGGPSTHTSGTVRVTGLAQHHVFNDVLPPDMEYGGFELSDSQQISSGKQPAFWLSDDGTAHDLTFEWGSGEAEATLVSFETVPAAPAPVFRSRHTELNHG